MTTLATNQAAAEERARRHRYETAISHVIRDRRANPGQPWSCRCPWCVAAIGEIARRAIERGEAVARGMEGA